jgi:hypothetical protein
MKKLLWMCLVTLAFAQTNYQAGQTVTSISAATSTTTGTVFVSGYPVSAFTWDSIISNGPAGAITVNLEGSNDNFVSTTIQLDQSTSTSTESRHVVNKNVKWFRCRITSYTASGSSESCQVTATYK